MSQSQSLGPPPPSLETQLLRASGTGDIAPFDGEDVEVPQSGYSVVVHAGCMWMYGGLAEKEVVLRDLWRLSLAGSPALVPRAAKRGAVLPEPRCHHTAEVTSDGRMLLLFGMLEGRQKGARADVVDVFDVHAKEWAARPVVVGPSPPYRCRHASCIHDDVVYVSGGFEALDADFRDVVGTEDDAPAACTIYALDTKTFVWRTIECDYTPPLYPPVYRWGHTMVCCGGSYLVLYGGGVGSSGSETEVLWVFDLKTRVWRGMRPWVTDGTAPPPTGSRRPAAQLTTLLDELSYHRVDIEHRANGDPDLLDLHVDEVVQVTRWGKDEDKGWGEGAVVGKMVPSDVPGCDSVFERDPDPPGFGSPGGGRVGKFALNHVTPLRSALDLVPMRAVPPARRYHSAVPIRDQRSFLIVGGQEGEDAGTPLADAWVFNIDQARWTQIAPTTPLTRNLLWQCMVWHAGAAHVPLLAYGELWSLNFTTGWSRLTYNIRDAPATPQGEAEDGVADDASTVLDGYEVRDSLRSGTLCSHLAPLRSSEERDTVALSTRSGRHDEPVLHVSARSDALQTRSGILGPDDRPDEPVLSAAQLPIEPHQSMRSDIVPPSVPATPAFDPSPYTGAPQVVINVVQSHAAGDGVDLGGLTVAPDGKVTLSGVLSARVAQTPDGLRDGVRLSSPTACSVRSVPAAPACHEPEMCTPCAPLEEPVRESAELSPRRTRPTHAVSPLHGGGPAPPALETPECATPARAPLHGVPYAPSPSAEIPVDIARADGPAGMSARDRANERLRQHFDARGPGRAS